MCSVNAPKPLLRNRLQQKGRILLLTPMGTFFTSHNLYSFSPQGPTKPKSGYLAVRSVNHMRVWDIYCGYVTSGYKVHGAEGYFAFPE